ncbi:MAG: hypothetical protein AMXMBFR81_22550 [Chthonomonas sp.]
MIGTLALAVGYFASQRAALDGQAPAYAAGVDVPAVRLAATVLFVALVVLALIRNKNEEQGA